MLCFTNSKFFSLPYKLQQTSQFRGDLCTGSNFCAIPGMDDNIPASDQTPVPADTFPDAALEEISTHRISKSLADRDAEAAVTQLVGTVEDLQESTCLPLPSVIDPLVVF